MTYTLASTALLLLLAAASLAGGPRVAPAVDRLVYEREDLMPPRQVERVGIRVLCATRDGVPVTTKVLQVSDLQKGRVGRLICEVPGEDLTGASVHDLNDDGVKEVLARFSPPGNQRLVRLVLLGYDRRDRVYAKAWEAGPATGLSARFVRIHRDRLVDEWGLEVRKQPDGAAAPTVTTYRYVGGLLQVAGGGR